jgi:hypothetical protein
VGTVEPDSSHSDKTSVNDGPSTPPQNVLDDNKGDGKPVTLEAFAQQCCWVLWGKNGKAPYTIDDTGKLVPRGKEEGCSQRLLTLAEAHAAIQKFDVRLGIVPTEENQLVIGDLDGCRNPTTHKTQPEAKRLIREWDTYTEISPSGEGYKVLWVGNRKHVGETHVNATWDKMGNKDPDIHLWNHAYEDTDAQVRYTTITLNQNDAKPKPLRTWGKKLDEWESPPKQQTSTPPPNGNTLTIADWQNAGLKKWKSRGGRKYTACCPAHDDEHPSLVLFDKGDGVAVSCSARCDYKDIAKAVGLWREPQSKPEGHSQDEPEREESKTLLTCLGDLEARAIDWIVDDFLPEGVPVGIFGESESKKGQFIAYLVAQLTTGGTLPNGKTVLNGKRPVVWLSSEEDARSRLRPRIEAAGGDCSLVYIATEKNLTLPSPVGNPTIEDYIREVSESHPELAPGVVILDPFESFMERPSDIWNSSALRKILTPLEVLGEDTGWTPIMLSHMSKNKGRNAADAPRNSKAIFEAWRLAFLLGKHPDKPDDKTVGVLCIAKGNDLPPEARRSWLVEQKNVLESKIIPNLSVDQRAKAKTIPFIHIGDAVNFTTGDVLATEAQKPGSSRKSLSQRCIDVLRDYVGKEFDWETVTSQVPASESTWKPALYHFGGERVRVQDPVTKKFKATGRARIPPKPTRGWV